MTTISIPQSIGDFPPPPPFFRLGSSDDGGEEDNRGASAAHSCLHPVKMSPTAYFGPEATRLPPDVNCY